MSINCCDRIAFGVAALSTGIATVARYGTYLLSNQIHEICHIYDTQGLGVLDQYIPTGYKTGIQMTCSFTAQSDPYLLMIGTIAAAATLYHVYRMTGSPYRK